jgi:hypothetical protein
MAGKQVKRLPDRHLTKRLEMEQRQMSIKVKALREFYGRKSKSLTERHECGEHCSCGPCRTKAFDSSPKGQLLQRLSILDILLERGHGILAVSQQVRALTKGFPGPEERELERQVAALKAEREQICNTACVEFGMCHLCQE